MGGRSLFSTKGDQAAGLCSGGMRIAARWSAYFTSHGEEEVGSTFGKDIRSVYVFGSPLLGLPHVKPCRIVPWLWRQTVWD